MKPKCTAEIRELSDAELKVVSGSGLWEAFKTIANGTAAGASCSGTVGDAGIVVVCGGPGTIIPK
jgi:hypothetical protein